ncbi:MAG: response regulator transcription factor [Cyclobacteriaceae bacterium]
MTAGPARRLLLIDDHQILIDGILELLSKVDEVNVTATASSAEQALSLISNEQFDLVVTDIGLPGMRGAELIAELKKRQPGIKVIALSMHEEQHIVKDALKAGADGYVLKKSTHHELEEAIRKVTKGEVFVSAEVTKMLIDDVKYPSIISQLSDREIEIIRLIVKEYTTKKIAEELFISDKTVESHKTNIFRKTGTSTLVGLTKFAIAHQLVEQSH